MNIKPILFNTDMVCAVMEGQKTVTRRLIKPQPRGLICFSMAGSDYGKWAYPSESATEYWGEEFRLPENLTEEERSQLWTPPCHTDDILWVRETFAIIFGKAIYKADCDDEVIARLRGAWKPSIHMSREAARLFLRVKNVRVEHLKDISYEDCKSEGIWDDYKTFSEKYHENLSRRAYPVVFAEIWDSTIKPKERGKYGWDANPWVWVISFDRCEKPKGWCCKP